MMSKPHKQQEFPQKNQRITVYWPNEDFWYIGTVISEMENGRRLQIEYDEDNTTDWIDTSVDKWRWATKHDTLVERKMKEKLSGLMIGSKLEIWWPHDREYFIGTLTNALTKGMEETNDRTEARSTTNIKKSNNPHHITYDDGDDEWTNLIYRKFKRVQTGSNQC